MSRGTWLSVLVGLATAGLVATATGQPLIGVTAGLLAMVAAALVYDCTRLLRRQRPTVAARPPDYHQLVIDVLRGKHTEHADALADEIERGRRRRKEGETGGTPGGT